MKLEPSTPTQFSPVRPSACPGLLRIVAARDGGICRIKLACGQITAAQALAIAAAAENCGSGVIEITNRANLQIRGVRAECSNELIEALLAAQLGPQHPGADDVRNLMVSPSAGIDTKARIDVAPLAYALLDLLQSQARFQELSPKFALLLDGGERLAMLEHPHDVWLSATADGEHFVFGFTGCPARDNPVARVSRDNVLALVDAVLNKFLDLATPQQTRMRHLLQSVSAHEFLTQVQTHLPFALSVDVDAWQREPSIAFAHIGIYPQRQHEMRYVGAASVLGRINSTQLRELAALAEKYGDGTLRFTPWQSVLLPNIFDANAEIVLRELNQLGLSTHIDDPLAHVIACTGCSGCVKGLADTKSDALQLAKLLAEKSLLADVHLTGCARSCAAAHIAPFTLLAVAQGRYDLFQRDLSTHGFGKLIARNCDIETSVALLTNSADTR
ncbi:MAG: cobG [Verrucomicrobiaceae bacterium]|nr:cobG [Verrucomicrobiaceae bacterium]